ncbi:MAG: DUF481 domain-containing protein [Acidobacteriota bacterium]
MSRSVGRSLLLALICWCLATPLAAQDDAELGWSNRAELGYVATDGNAEASSLGLDATSTYAWPDRSLELRLAGLRADSTTVTRTAVGTPDNFSVNEESDTEVTAENYFAQLRFDRDLTDDFYVYGSGSWERDEFAGFDRRLTAVVGAGRVFFDVEDQRLFKADLGVTYVDQQDLVDAPGSDDGGSVGLRATSEWFRRLSPTTTVGMDLIVDLDLDDTSDLRLDDRLWVAVQMTEQLALKVSLRLKYDAEPSFESVPLTSPAGDLLDDSVFVQLDELDSIFNVALVVDF